jgi:hypothetical protein
MLKTCDSPAGSLRAWAWVEAGITEDEVEKLVSSSVNCLLMSNGRAGGVVSIDGLSDWGSVKLREGVRGRRWGVVLDFIGLWETGGDFTGLGGTCSRETWGDGGILVSTNGGVVTWVSGCDIGKVAEATCWDNKGSGIVTGLWTAVGCSIPVGIGTGETAMAWSAGWIGGFIKPMVVKGLARVTAGGNGCNGSWVWALAGARTDGPTVGMVMFGLWPTDWTGWPKAVGVATGVRLTRGPNGLKRGLFVPVATGLLDGVKEDWEEATGVDAKGFWEWGMGGFVRLKRFVVDLIAWRGRLCLGIEGAAAWPCMDIGPPGCVILESNALFDIPIDGRFAITSDDFGRGKAVAVAIGAVEGLTSVSEKKKPHTKEDVSFTGLRYFNKTIIWNVPL